MSRQKAATRLRRENKRTSRKEQRNGSYQDNVTVLPGFSSIDTIGMAREKRDEKVLSPRTEAQRQYMNAIQHQNLVFATGEAGCEKRFLVRQWQLMHLLIKK